MMHRTVLPVVPVGSDGGSITAHRTAVLQFGILGRQSPGFSGGCLSPLVGFVRRLVELVEQEEEHDGVHSDPPDEGSRVVAVDEQQLEGVHHDCDKLDHLQAGEVFLPPEILLELGSEGCEQVVRVHHDVYEGVEQSEEGTVATGGELDAEPHGHGHASVMNYVQRRHLTSFFAHYEEERIEEFRELGEVVPPARMNHP